MTVSSSRFQLPALVRPLISIGGVLVIALVLRGVFMLLAGLRAPLTGDELAYQQIAENFAAGRGLFQTNNPFFPGQALYAWQAPLYPLLLGLVYQLTGPNPVIGRIVNLLISTATVYGVHDLAQRVLPGSPQSKPSAISPALVASLWVAVYPGLLTLSHLLLSETLYIFFLVAAFALAARGLDERTSRRRFWIWTAAAGAAWGLAALTRGISLYFTPLFALWLGWQAWRGDKARLRHAVVPALLFLGACVGVIAPYAVRNAQHFHQLVLLETKGGVNLWLGNSPYTPYVFIRNVWKVGVREPMLNALPPGEVERDRAAYGLALNYLRADPASFVARLPGKFADFWGFERNLVDIAEATTRGEGWNSLSKIAADLYGILGYVLIMFCGIAGLVYASSAGQSFRATAAGATWRVPREIPRADPWAILLAGFILYFMAVHLIIFGDGRFHLPLIPVFALYAGWLLVERPRVTTAPRKLAIVILLALVLTGVWLREAWVALQVLHGGPIP